MNRVSDSKKPSKQSARTVFNTAAQASRYHQPGRTRRDWSYRPDLAAKADLAAASAKEGV